MIIDVDRVGPFRLSDDFVETYRRRPVRWGFGALSWVIYKRTYSRDNEQWWQTCRRVIEGMCTIQRVHCDVNGIGWDEAAVRGFAEEAYDRLWRFKWTPPGRGLWIMGTRFVWERGGAALNNCGFVSTKDLAVDFSGPFTWMLRMAMLGVGVGFDTRGKNSVTLSAPAIGDDAHVIADSREGWAEALARLLDAHVGKARLPARWDYSEIRPLGRPLESFGGRASGPDPLRKMLDALGYLFAEYVGLPIDARFIVDTMNIIGRCVVAGGVRRAAQIAFGDSADRQFRELKADPQKLLEYRWASNNSVYAEVGMDYTELVDLSMRNGEPGYLWLDNARAYGRLADPANHRDARALGSNPCIEQTLWDRELCCLVETYPAHHDDLDDYLATLGVAYQYAKTVTLVPTLEEPTDAVMMQNRRLGCSMTGIVQAINKFGYRGYLNWCDRGYAYLGQLDRECSKNWRIPESIKLTSVKPSGTVSILAGATPGVHWEHAPHYVRRVRIAADHPLAAMCRRAGYDVVPDAYSEATLVISFPVHVPNLGRSKSEVPLYEKVDLAAQLQRYWSDNQVSCTADFDPEREGPSLGRLLSAYEDRLKAIVFLPSHGHGYLQPPYETISREQYESMLSKLGPIEGELDHDPELEERFCEGGICDVVL